MQKQAEILAHSCPPVRLAFIGAKSVVSLSSAFQQRLIACTLFFFLETAGSKHMYCAHPPSRTTTSPSAKCCTPLAMTVSIHLKTDRCHIWSRMSHFFLVPQNLHNFDQLLKGGLKRLGSFKAKLWWNIFGKNSPIASLVIGPKTWLKTAAPKRGTPGFVS